MAVNLVRKSKNEDEEERRKQLLAQMQQNSQARKDADIQTVQNMKLNWVDPNVNLGTGIGWLGRTAGNQAKKSVLDTLTALPQSYAVGLQRGANQAAQENSTWDKIKNFGKNYLKSVAYSAGGPTGILLYNATIGRKDLVNDYLGTATKIAQNYEQAQTGFGKAGAIIGGVSSKVIQDNNSLLQNIYNSSQQVGQMLGTENATKAAEGIQKLDDKLHEKNEKRAEELQREGSLYKGSSNVVLNTVGNLEGTAQTIGYMTPSIAINIATGGGSSGAQAIGLTQMGLASKSNVMRESLKQGADLETAERRGVASGTIEAGTELMWNGLDQFKALKKDGLEGTIKNWISNTVENKFGNELVQKGLKTTGNWLVDVTGESIEELTSDIYNTWLDQATIDPNKQYTLNDAINTVVQTVTSTTFMNAGQGIANKIIEIKRSNTDRKSPVTEVEQTASNGYKENLQEMINNLDIPNEIKSQIQPMLDSNDIISEKQYKDITNNIKTLVKANTQQQIADYGAELTTQYNAIEEQRQNLDNIKPESFKDKDYRRLYAQLTNESELQDETYNNILTLYPTNKNGNRPLSDWQNIARDYGKAMAEEGRSFDEVRHNIVKIWIDEKPFDRQQTSKNGQKVPTQRWYPVDQFTKTAYDSYRDTMKAQLDQQQKDLADTANARLEEIQDEENILIDTIDNLKPRATPEQVAKTKKLVEDFAKARGVNVEYNAEVFKNNNEEGFIKDKGNGERTIYINPNADTDTILVKLATHEMFHDTIRTQPHDKLTQLVMDKLKADENYDMYRQSVVDAYLDELNKLENTNKEALTIDELTDKQNALIDEEMTAKYLGEYLGDEQFVQQLVNSTNRSTIQKIMDWIDNRLQQIKNVVTGNKEAEYWRKVRENFEKAYNSEYQGEQGKYFSKESEKQNNVITNKDNYNSEPKEGYIRLYTNTKADNLDAILKEGLRTDIGRDVKEYEGNMLWFETTPDLKGYGGTTIAVDIPKNSNMSKVNNTQYTVYDNISPDNIVFIDKPAFNHYRTSDLNELVEKYGKDKVLEVYDKSKNKSISREELVNLIDNIDSNTNNTTTDNQGRTLTKEQQEYFKDSKVRDRDGNLITLYHGTDNEVTTFDTNKPTYARYGSGAYLTDGIGIASDFADIRAESNNGKARIIEGYANIDKMFDNTTGLTENTPERQKLFELLKERGLSDRQLSNIESAEIDYPFQLMERYLVKDEVTNDPWIKANTVNELLREAGYNGIKGYYGDGSYEYVTFNSNQIKDIENKTPTNDADIRYSKKTAFDKALQKDTKGRTLTKEQQEFFKDVPDILRDYDGNLRVYYRGSQDDFTVFDRKKASSMGGQGNGFYFTTSEEHAKQYGNVKEYYLNIKNPLINTFRVQQEIDNGTYQKQISKEQLKKLVTEMSNNEDFDLENYGYNSTVDSIVDDLWQKATDYGMLEDLNATAYGNMAQFVDYVNDTLGTNFDGIVTDYETVVLKPEQIKRTDNLNPTDNPDIRYSKKTKFDEALKENIETTNNGKNLLALHNLNEDKLRGVLELGGFPVPSIAVTNNPMSNANFGEISVVFNKDTINPELDSRNKVYGRDAYTSRMPDIANKINEKGLKEVSKATGIEEWRLRENFKETTLEKAVDELRTNEEILDKYLKEKGIEVKPVYRDFKGLSSLNQDSLQKFINEHSDLLNLNYTDQQTYSTYEKYYNDVHNLFVENLMNDPSGEITRETAENLYKDYPGYNHWNYFIKDLRTVNELNGGQQLDEYATRKAKEKAVDIDSKEYKDFVSNLISPMFEGKYVRNNKDYYTKTGTPRSFEQRYEDYTLENIVKIMNENKGTGQEGSPFGVGIGELAGDASKRFKSIEDIKNNEYLLDTKNKEEYKALLDKYGDEFRDLQSDITKKYGDKDVESIIWRDRAVADAMQNIARKIADGKKISVDSVIKQYNKNNIDVTEKQAQQTIDLLNDISSLPTDYFEAKPQRAVGFDEIDTVVLPSNTSEDIKQALTDRGIKYIEYDSNNENARSDILKALDEYKFNKKAKAFDDYLKANNPNRSGVTIGDLKNLPAKQPKITQPILPTTNVQPTAENLEIPNEQTSIPLGEQVNPSERKQRKAYKSIIESPVMSEEAKKVARKFIGQDTYTPDSNLKQLERADNIISRLGTEKALNQLESNAMEGRTIKAEDIATGDRLIEYYSKIGDSKNLQRAIRATAMAGTQAGRSVQAFALLKHQTPQGMAIWIQNSVDKLNSNMKNGQFDFTPEMKQKIASSTEENLQENANEVMKELGQQVPQDLLGKLDSWRYFSMLANPKTHIRNIVGNFAMGLTQQFKSKVAGTIEQVTGQDRTHTSFLEKRNKANIDFAKDDLKNVSAQLGIGESKYSNPKTQIQQNQRVFKSDALEKTLGRMFKLNDNLLEAEDNFGLKNAYVRNLSDYMTANKLNPNTITNEQLQQARKIAIEEALRATFHQESSLASMLNQLESKNSLTRTLVGGLVPFKKTPINVAKSGFEYSPAGLAKAIVYDSVQLRKGNINVNEYIDNISKGLTGTGIALVGYALAEAGILKAAGDDDKEDKYKEAMGEQPYSITINGKSYSLDWLAPTGIPLFVGAELNKLVHDTTEKEGETQNGVLKAIGRVTDATSSLLNPMSEMSMISGLTSTLQSYSQDPGQALMNLPINMLKSYTNQFVPTAVGQVARTMDKYERDTSSTETGLLPKAIDQTKNQIMNKIPGLRQLLPTKKDIWGNEVETQDYFHNAVLPYTKKEIKTNAVDKELNDLYERTGESIYPNTSLSKTVTYEGSKTRLTNQDYNEFKTNYGKTSYKLLEDLTKSQEYKGMTDAQKVQAIKDVYTYANNLNKTEYAEKKGIEFKTPTDVQQVRAVKAYGGKESDYFKYKGITDGLSKDSEKMVALRDSNLSAKSKRAVYSATLGKDDTFFQSTDINVNEYLGYKTANIQGTKDSNGKTIFGSEKAAQLDYINNNISGYENRLLLMGKDYKLSRSQQQDLAAYIDTLDNAEELYTMFDKNFTVKSSSSLGQYGKGNIDLYNRPIVTNSDGSISTVRSMSFEENGKEILIPTVVNGRVVSDDEAIDHYHRTGEYLGKFNSVKEADDYAEKLHEDQEKMYSSGGRTTGYTVYYK